LRLVEADVGLTWQPHPIAPLRFEWRRQSPDLYIPRSSIFSVFSEETRDEYGARAAVRVFGRLDLDGDFHGLTDATGQGYLGGARAQVRLGALYEATLGAQVRVLRLATRGYVQARLFALWRIRPELVVTLDADAY